MIKIGEVIKRLRKENEMTQDKLGEYLGVSYQAISKWENGVAFPDITLLPKIANVFDVSIDELFSMNSSIREQSIESYKEKYKILQSVGNISDIIELSTKILEEYPNEYEVMLNLAKAMFITMKVLAV